MKDEVEKQMAQMLAYYDAADLSGMTAAERATFLSMKGIAQAMALSHRLMSERLDKLEDAILTPKEPGR